MEQRQSLTSRCEGISNGTVYKNMYLRKVCKTPFASPTQPDVERRVT